MEAAEISAKKRKFLDTGCSCLGWLVFILAFIGIVLLGYRVWYYSDKLRRGQIIDIPAFTPKLTSAGGSAAISSVFVEPAIVNGVDEPFLGNGQSPRLTIVEFGDFQCPFSAEASNAVRSLMTRYGDQVRFIYRDYPIETLHPLAAQAAQAAECAREQGKFWPYHDKLYANQSSLTLASMLGFGQEIGLDSARFESCVAEGRFRSLVDADAATAKLIGINGTPTFFFNGQRVEGVIPEDIFEKIIQTMLR